MKRIKVGLVLVIMGLVISIIFINKPNNTYKTVEEHIQEGNTIAFMKQEKDGSYTKVDDIPTGYDFNSKKSICSNNATPTWENGKLKINNLTSKNTACYLYFDRGQSVLTLESLALESKGIIGDITGPACDNDSNCGDTTIKRMNQNGVYEAPDDDGTSYIFRGTVDNNWVKFGQTTNGEDIWWRILRINGDGTIRLIYADTNNSLPNEIGETTQISIKAYKEQPYGDNTYVGYYYGTAGADDFSKTHSNITPNTIASEAEDWFSKRTKLDETPYISYIDENAGFCNDRKITKTASASSNYHGEGYGVESTGYASWGRIQQDGKTLSSLKSTFKCSGENTEGNFENNTDYKRDYYTWKGYAKRGNQALNYPVGLITMDEAILAGGFYNKSNTGYWLCTNQYYWTMTPHYYNSGVRIFVMSSKGEAGSADASGVVGVRPVINLKADTKFKTSVGESEWGTKENPYIVEVTE